MKMRWVAAVAAIVMSVGVAAAEQPSETIAAKTEPIVISEVVSSNHGSFEDAKGRKPDWIELQNTSDEAVSLAGYGVSDREGKEKFSFAEDATLEAGAFLVVLACGEESMEDTGEYRAAFKLKADGETVYLFKDGEVVGQVELPKLGEDVAYARNDAGEYEIVTATTPMAANLFVDEGKEEE